jgi:hypothetical protein
MEELNVRILSTVVIAVVVSLACCPSLLADEPDGSQITIRITSDGIVIGSINRPSEATCNDAAKDGTQVVCRGLKIQAAKGRTAHLELTDVVVPPAFGARPVVSEFPVGPANHQGVFRAEGAGPPHVRTHPPVPQAINAAPIRPFVFALAAAHQDEINPTPELPKIPESLTPKNGSVVEYWPNGEKKSEREYRDGRVINAVYYASNGTVVFEMSSNEP